MLHPKCFYTYAHSMRHKLEKLKALAWAQLFYITGISENCWDESCDWSALLDSSRLFRSNRQGGRSRGVALYMIEGLECMNSKSAMAQLRAFGYKSRGKQITLMWESTIDWLPSQEDDTDKLFFEELRDASKSTALVLMKDFNLPEINRKHHTAGTTRARRFLKTLDDNFVEQALREQLGKMPSLICFLSTERIAWAKWRLAAILATATVKQLNLKSLLTARKVPANLQFWIRGEQNSSCSRN